PSAQSRLFRLYLSEATSAGLTGKGVGESPSPPQVLGEAARTPDIWAAVLGFAGETSGLRDTSENLKRPGAPEAPRFPLPSSYGDGKGAPSRETFPLPVNRGGRESPSALQDQPAAPAATPPDALSATPRGKRMTRAASAVILVTGKGAEPTR